MSCHPSHHVALSQCSRCTHARCMATRLNGLAWTMTPRQGSAPRAIAAALSLSPCPLPPCLRSKSMRPKWPRSATPCASRPMRPICPGPTHASPIIMCRSPGAEAPWGSLQGCHHLHSSSGAITGSWPHGRQPPFAMSHCANLFPSLFGVMVSLMP
jgi:hypothetical protein